MGGRWAGQGQHFRCTMCLTVSSKVASERRRDEARWRDEERWCDEECMKYEVMRDVVPMGNASPAYLYMDAWPVPKHCKKQEY